MTVHEKPTPERPVSGERIRLDSLTALRFAAALLVFVLHVYVYVWYAGGDMEQAPFGAVALRSALAGVSFFFLLSGFVLTWSAREDDTPRAFLRRRLAKIYPNHAVTWVVALVLLLWAGEQVGALRALSTLLLVEAWIPLPQVQSGVNPVSWTLACELFFYLCFPYLHRLVARIRPERLWYWAVGCLAAIALVPLLVMAVTPAEPKGGPFQTTLLQTWLTYNFPPVRLLEFVLGILLARIVITGRWYPKRLGPALISVPLGYVVALQVAFPYFVHAILVVPLAMMVLAAAHSDITGSPGLRRRSWIWLGDISFAFYMTHVLVILHLHGLLDPERDAGVAADVGFTALYLVISVLVSWLLYRAVERPAMRRWGSARGRRTAAR
ncbi:acyltransferase [Actinosynnema sp. NPDC002837]